MKRLAEFHAHFDEECGPCPPPDGCKHEVPCREDCHRFGHSAPGWMFGSNWPWVPCPECNGTGEARR